LESALCRSYLFLESPFLKLELELDLKLLPSLLLLLLLLCLLGSCSTRRPTINPHLEVVTSSPPFACRATPNDRLS
jgi:hypothetical protein